MSIFNELIVRFPVRNTPAQKQAFRDYVCAAEGLNAKVETLEKHDNVVIGDPGNAKMIFTAHYDTPRSMLFPNLMLPTSRVLFILYQAAVILALLVPSVAAGVLVMNAGEGLLWRELGLLTYVVIYFGLFFLVMRRGINLNNYNDNTSGTAAVLELAKKIPEEMRSKAAFVLFDDEEKGLKGSKAMAKAYPAVKENTLILNLDCVGNGDNFVFVYGKALRGDPILPKLEQAMARLGSVTFICASRGNCNSDQKSFQHGIGVCACKKSRRGVLYTPNIHTKKDVEADPANVDRLSDAMAEVPGLL